MKRILLTLSILVSLVFSGLILPAQAFDPFDQACTGASDSTVCQDRLQAQSATNNSLYGPNGVITRAIGLLSIVVGIASVIVIMLAGLRFITAGGDANNVASAKNTAKYAVIGVLITLLARGLIMFVFNKL